MAYKPANKILSEKILINAYSNNDHGAGFAFSHKGKLIMRKGFFDFKEFYKAFDKIQRGNPAIIHFRNASSGSKNEENCHPFLINKNICVAHNGILTDWIPNAKDKQSDTLWFVEAMLKPLFTDVPEAHLNPVYQLFLDKTIETGNKLLFLDNKGRKSIIRAHAGVWVKGCWFSNESYKKPRQTENTNDTVTLYQNWLKANGPRPPFNPRNNTERILGAPSQLGQKEERVPFHKMPKARKEHPFYEFNQNDGNMFRKIIEMQGAGLLDSGDMRRMMG